jgi:hypothetical protein
MAEEPIQLAYTISDVEKRARIGRTLTYRRGARRVRNPATWATRDEAERWANGKRGDGIGIMLSELDNGAFLCGVDLRHARMASRTSQLRARFDPVAQPARIELRPDPLAQVLGCESVVALPVKYLD